MLMKHRDLGSMPDGLCRVAENVTKGMGLVRKLVDGVYVLAKPTSAEEAKAFYGFVTLDIEYKEHKGSYYDEIEKGTLAVCYTRVKDNEWKTTEFNGELAVGDKCAIGFSGANAGKVVKVSDGSETMEVVGKIAPMAGYEQAMVIVKLL